MDNEFIDQVYAACGGRKALQEALQLSKQALSNWKRDGYVPARHAVAVERLSGIHRSRLCPDFDWGDSKCASPASAASCA